MPKKIDRTGETRTMSNGLQATIISYRNCLDIDIAFENGQIVRKRRYVSFCSGAIKSQLVIERHGDSIKVINHNIKLVFWASSEDRGIIEGQRWYINSKGYVQGGGDFRLLHRLITNAQPEECVDHIDGNRLNNRRSNLRLCNVTENNRNQPIRKDNTSGYRGVHWHESAQKWRAQIAVDRQLILLEDCDTIEEAARVYNEAAIMYYGEYARPNIIE